MLCITKAAWNVLLANKYVSQLALISEFMNVGSGRISRAVNLSYELKFALIT